MVVSEVGFTGDSGQMEEEEEKEEEEDLRAMTPTCEHLIFCVVAEKGFRE